MSPKTIASTKLQGFATVFLILLLLALYNIMSFSTRSMQSINDVSMKKVSVHIMLNAGIMRLDSTVHYVASYCGGGFSTIQIVT